MCRALVFIVVYHMFGRVYCLNFTLANKVVSVCESSLSPLSVCVRARARERDRPVVSPSSSSDWLSALCVPNQITLCFWGEAEGKSGESGSSTSSKKDQSREMEKRRRGTKVKITQFYVISADYRQNTDYRQNPYIAADNWPPR